MKNSIIIIILLNLFICSGQNTSESKLITKIEKQILKRKVIKKELFNEIGYAGGYEKTTIYLKNNIPILIEKEEKQVDHAYLAEGNQREIDIVTFVIAKFYIVNWKEDIFLRIGKFKYSDGRDVTMPKELIFRFDRTEIEKLINTT